VDDLVRRAAVGNERALATHRVDEPAPHRDGAGEHRVVEADARKGVNAAGREAN
jgi:hypothetical protein